MPGASAISLRDAPPPSHLHRLAPDLVAVGHELGPAAQGSAGTPDILAVFSTSPVSLSMPRALSFESWLYTRTPDWTKRSNYSSAPPKRSGAEQSEILS